MDSIINPILFEAAANAGEPLEYSPEFAEFEALATPREERQVGAHIIPAQEPDWSAVFKAGCALLEKSRDLRILVKVCQAALHKHGLPGFAQCVSLIQRWVENDWDNLYPPLNIDGEYDPLFRSNAIAELSSREGIVHTLRQAVFLETPIGAIPVSSVENLLAGKTGDGETIVSSPEQLARIVIDERSRGQERFDALASLAASLAAITATFKTQLATEYWPDIGLLTEIVTRISRFVTERLQEAEAANGQAGGAHTTSTADVAAKPPGTSAKAEALPGAVHSRAAAIRALALAREYFENHEPSHPAPLLIRRIERIADQDFLAIVQDLMPESIQQLMTLAGQGGQGGGG
ncbi:MAG: type VI secretion system protein TssA [Azoarcus sp.]|jgi:type VI secretion system protein ImpA|nr:type VI secretion system protein TssA [Azoarcus sp.]